MEEEGGQGEPLLAAQAGAAAAMDSDGAGSVVPWMARVVFIFLTFNSAMAVNRSNGYRADVAFVVSSYACLMALFLCLRLFERPPPGSATRGMVTTTVLAVISSFKVAGIMPVPVQLLVWGMAVAPVVGGFYAFFVYWKKRKDQTERGFVLATLRSQSPEADLRDAARSGARLIADSGATRHAVGDISLLEGFQPYSPPLVATQADGSYLRILGTGRIQRGNFSIPNVSLVEGLRDGLISTPQLDTDHGLISCFGNGICRIMETDGTEVGGAILEGDGSYVLRFLNVAAPAQVQ